LLNLTKFAPNTQEICGYGAAMTNIFSLIWPGARDDMLMIAKSRNLDHLLSPTGHNNY